MAFTNNPMLVLILRVIQTILAILTLGLTAYGEKMQSQSGQIQALT